MDKQENAKPKMQKVTGEKSAVKRLCCAAAVIVIVLAAAIGIGVYRSGASQLQKHLELGQKYLDELNYEQAVVEFGLAIEIDPKCVDAYLGMAEAYAGEGKYEDSLAVFDRLLELAGEDERALDGLGGCLSEYIKVLLGENRYDEIKALAEKYGALTLGVDFGQIPGQRTESGSLGTGTEEPVNTDPTQVSIRMTDIKADSVFNMGGYGSLKIQGVGSLWEMWPDTDGVVPPQAALVDSDGSFVFPYQSTYLRYRVSDGIVSLTEGSPYALSEGYDWEEYTPAYYHLDGSSVFIPESGTSQIDEHTTETIQWWCGPMTDGYALAIKLVYTHIWDGVVGAAGQKCYSYIIDKSGTITCTLPEEFNQEVEFGFDGFRTRYALGWCGGGLFAVFEQDHDENWNYTLEMKGYMDSAGNMAIDLTGSGYTDLWPFHEGLAAVQAENGMIGFIDKTGALVIPCTYSDSGSFSEDGLCEVEKDGKWGYIDRDNNVVIPFEYDGAYGAGGGLASVVQGGKCGLVDYSNHIVVALEYDDISSFEGGVAYAIKDGVLYIITK